MRKCPKCGKGFPDGVVMCPFDRIPLPVTGSATPPGAAPAPGRPGSPPGAEGSMASPPVRAGGPPRPPGSPGMAPRPPGTIRSPGVATPASDRGTGFYARNGCFTFLLSFVGVVACQMVAPDLKALSWVVWIIALTVSGQIVGRSQGLDKQEISRVTNWGAGFFFLMALFGLVLIAIGAFLGERQKVSTMFPPSSPPRSTSTSSPSSSGSGATTGRSGKGSLPATRGSRDLSEDIGVYLRMVADLGKLEKEGARAFSENPTDDKMIRYLESSRPDWIRMEERFEAHSPGTSEIQKIHREVKRHLSRRIDIHRDMAAAFRTKDAKRLERLVEDFKTCQTGMSQAGTELGKLAVQNRVDVKRYGF